MPIKSLTPNSRKPKQNKTQHNKKKNRQRGARPKQFDIITDGYAKHLGGQGNRQTERDKLIAAILQSNKMQAEQIRRLVIEESRLDVLMRLLGFRVSPHHQVFIEFFEKLLSIGIKSGLLLGPRGSGKSTSCDVCYVVMRALQNPNINVLIASRALEQSKSFLASIKGHFERPQFIEVFGDLKGAKWDETAASIKGREPGQMEQTFHVAGADGAVVSKHFDLIICDDLVDEKNAKGETNRDNILKFYYKTLLPTLKADGEIRVLGTRYHPEDLYGHLISKDPYYKNSYMILPGIFDKTTGEPVDLIENEDGSFSLPENGMVWDEEGFPEKEILTRRAGMPQGDFEAQYQNRIEMLKGDYFDSDDFRYYEESPVDIVKRLNLKVWMGVDLAASLEATADEFAIVVVGIDPGTLEIYVLDYVAGRYKFSKQKELLVDMFDQWQPIRTFVEANAYQRVLESEVADEFPDVRTQPIWTTKDKESRAQAFSVYYERHRVFHRKGRSAKLEGQLTGFPHLKLKDLFDGLYIAVWGAFRGARRRRRRTKEPGLFGRG